MLLLLFLLQFLLLSTSDYHSLCPFFLLYNSVCPVFFSIMSISYDLVALFSLSSSFYFFSTNFFIISQSQRYHDFHSLTLFSFTNFFIISQFTIFFLQPFILRFFFLLSLFFSLYHSPLPPSTYLIYILSSHGLKLGPYKAAGFIPILPSVKNRTLGYKKEIY